jgi:hypothetical protein
MSSKNLRPMDVGRYTLVWIMVSALATAPLRAQTAPVSNHLNDRYQLNVSGTTVWLGSTIRVDNSDGTPGTEIDQEDLGVARQTWEPRLAFRWRPGKRDELEVGYQFARSSGSHVLTDSIRFADTSFAKGLRVNSSVKSDLAFLTYRFAFHAGERSQLGAAVGIGTLLFHMKLDAVAGATSGGADTAITQYSASKGFSPPIGSVGFYGRWRVGDQWYIEGDLRAVYVGVNRLSATVLEAGGAGRYFVSQRFGLELGYGLTGVNVTLDPRTNGGGFAGQLKYTLQNARLSVVASL